MAKSWTDRLEAILEAPACIGLDFESYSPPVTTIPASLLYSYRVFGDLTASGIAGFEQAAYVEGGSFFGLSSTLMASSRSLWQACLRWRGKKRKSMYICTWFTLNRLVAMLQDAFFRSQPQRLVQSAGLHDFHPRYTGRGALLPVGDTGCNAGRGRSDRKR